MEVALRVDQRLLASRLKLHVDSMPVASPSCRFTSLPCCRVIKSKTQAHSLQATPGRRPARLCCRAQSSQTEEPAPRQVNRATSGAVRSSSDHPVTNLDCVANGLTVECVLHTDPPTQTLDEARSQSAGNGSLLLPAELPDGLELENADLDCVATGLSVECINGEELDRLDAVAPAQAGALELAESRDWTSPVLDTLLLISPFFFWGSAMVAMKVSRVFSRRAVSTDERTMLSSGREVEVIEMWKYLRMNSSNRRTFGWWVSQYGTLWHTLCTRCC